MTIEEIKQLLDGITPGEWETRQALPYTQALLVFSGRFENNRTICRGEWCTAQGDADMKFIAAAPAAIRTLLAEVERLSNSLTAIDKELRGYVNDPDPLPNTFPQAARRTTTYGLVAGIRRERDSLQALSASRLADQEYKKVIDDALVVANIGAATGDAKADVHKLICWEIDVALDPRVSKRAADLIRLADQEAIERHVTERVAREILLIMDGSESYEDAVSEIRNQYGVE